MDIATSMIFTPNKALIWMPRLLSLLLILALAYACAQSVWLFSGVQQTPLSNSVTLDAPNRTKNNPDTAIADATAIADRHLFGKAETQGSKKVISAPETKLNLQLRGILAIGEEDGLAIIAAGNNKEDVYSVNDRIPGNATLKAVYSDRVLLESGRGLETLRLPKNKDLINFSDSSSRSTPAQSSNRARSPAELTSAESLGTFRRQLIRNPTSLSGLARAAPAKINGEFKGFRLTPQSDDPMFGALGLESGDIVTEVNGIAIRSQQDGLKVLRSLMKARKLDATVLRNGQEVKIQHELGR